MSELPCRASRRSLGPPHAQCTDAGASISDGSPPPPTAVGVRTTDAAPAGMLGAADIEASAARVAELRDRQSHGLNAGEVAALRAVDVAYLYGGGTTRAGQGNRP